MWVASPHLEASQKPEWSELNDARVSGAAVSSHTVDLKKRTLIAIRISSAVSNAPMLFPCPSLLLETYNITSPEVYSKLKVYASSSLGCFRLTRNLAKKTYVCGSSGLVYIMKTREAR